MLGDLSMESLNGGGGDQLGHLGVEYFSCGEVWRTESSHLQ